LSHSTVLFSEGFFEIGSHGTICPGCFEPPSS
jgi:hypothetical protein